MHDAEGARVAYEKLSQSKVGTEKEMAKLRKKLEKCKTEKDHGESNKEAEITIEIEKEKELENKLTATLTEHTALLEKLHNKEKFNLLFIGVVAAVILISILLFLVFSAIQS